MESIHNSLPTVIQYYKGNDGNIGNIQASISDNFENQQLQKPELSEDVPKLENLSVNDNDSTLIEKADEKTHDYCYKKGEKEIEGTDVSVDVKTEPVDSAINQEIKCEDEIKTETEIDTKAEENLEENNGEEEAGTEKLEALKAEETAVEKVPKKRGRKRKYPPPTIEGEPVSNSSTCTVAGDNQPAEDIATEAEEEEDEIDIRPRKRGRCKKNPDIIPSYLSSDIVLGYKILLKFLETPQFSGFHKPLPVSAGSSQITCLNQIKKKFEENAYNKISEFVNDVREMLTNIYESRNSLATKRALRLEQILEQRIAQLPNYLRPQCALVLSPDDLNNSQNKIRINKGGGFVSLLLEKAEKRRCEKDKEKRKLLAEERKQLKEEQDKDVQEWEKNVLLKGHEEEIKSMWELPAIGHFIHLCTDILNIGEVAQFEVERMLLMPQCCETLDLIMTALLSNSLVRAKLDRTPPMPYSIWSPLVTTRVVSWYRAWHREGRNEQKIFEEIGVEPEFWQVLGPDVNPLDYNLFHELSLFQRVWILKTLCDVDFVRKKTVHDNIRAQTLDELNPINLGVDRHGNRYIQLKQFCGPDMRIYRQCADLEGDFNPAELIESIEGFETREGPITIDKVFKDIWDVGEKPEVKFKKKKVVKTKKIKVAPKVNNEIVEKKNLRQSARTKQRSYVVDTSDSDQSDTDLATLKNKLRRSDTETLYRPFSDKEFISLSVFRLPRDKVSKPTPKKNSYVPRKFEDFGRSDCASSDKCTKLQDKKDSKPTGFEDEASDSLDVKQMQDMQVDFEKNFQVDDINEEDFDVESKLSNFTLDKDDVKDKFTVKNLDNLKMVFKKGSSIEDESSLPNAADKLDSNSCESSKLELSMPSTMGSSEAVHQYNVPDHLKPDCNKFYLVVDSVDGLRQLISKFASHENDLEIISRSTKSSKRNNSQKTSSCEVQLIERLQSLLAELEPWEWDLIKSCRSNREKMYKEYMSFINRPSDFVHPNEAYWMKMYEEPTPTSTATSSNTAGSNCTATAEALNTTSEKVASKMVETPELNEASSCQTSVLDELGPRKRTRVTRLQLKPDEQDDLDDELGEDDAVESSESDDNWELPTSQRKRVKKDAPPRISRPKRVIRKSRGNIEKNESQCVTMEKSTQSSGPEKSSKALFWGPRSSDPSEDLNWETNRQKILEKHNSPTKKVLFKGEEIAEEMADVENSLQNNVRKVDNTTKTVITSPKRFITQIPGNKKPYFSSAQLKAMDDQAKRKKQPEDIQFVHHKVSKTYSLPKSTAPKSLTISTIEPSSSTSSEINIQSNIRVNQEHNTNNANNNNNSLIVNSGGINNNNNNSVSNFNEKQLNQMVKASQSISKGSSSPFPESVNTIQTVITTLDESSSSNIQQQPKIIQQIRKPVGQIQSPLQKTDGQLQYQTVNTIQKVQPGTQLIQIQKSVGQVQEVQQGTQPQQKPVVQQLHVQQPINQITQVQIPQPLSQIHPTFIHTNAKDGAISLSNIRLHQPVQLQPSNVISVQQPIQLQSQTMQMQTPRVTTIQQPLQVQTPKVATVQQSVQTSQQAPKAADDLYLTDGTVLIKADSNFVQQFMQKDKVLTLNINEKLDFKKPLFIVKPKTDVNTTSNHNLNPNCDPAISQQNIIVFNKAPAVQQSAVPTSVTNLVIPTNYIVSDNNTVQSQIDPTQNLTVVQQNPTFIIRQKPMVNKVAQPQIIKILDPQNMAANQNVILSPANIKFTNPVVRPVSQSVITSEPQPKPASTLRFIRPQNVISAAQSVIQNKMTTVQNSKGNVNSAVQMQIPRFDGPKPQLQQQQQQQPQQQPSVITSKIITSPVSNVRINSPTIQAQPVRTVVSAPTQSVRFPAGSNAGIKLVNRFVRPPKTSVITSISPTPVTVVSGTKPAGVIGQPIRLQNVNLQPSIIRTGQSRLQFTPTKIITRAGTPLNSPIIIKLEGEENVRLVEDKSLTDQAVAIDYLPGDLPGQDTNQSWMYVVKASDGSDVILTNEQLEKNTSNNDCMK